MVAPRGHHAWHLGLQAYAIWAGVTRSLVWPVMWPTGIMLYPTILVIYYVGYSLQNAMLALELVRKSHLESEQLAARRIRNAAADQPRSPLRLRGRRVLQAVPRGRRRLLRRHRLPGERTLFAVADVSGKGMAAALLAANIQALVQSLSAAVPDVPALASQSTGTCAGIRQATVSRRRCLIVLERESGAVSYVNAGHNPPIVWGPQPATFLEATGTALGWFEDTACTSAGSSSRPMVDS